MLSSSRDVLLMLSETTSPQKLFPCNKIGSYSAVISSWIALTRHSGMKTTFYTKEIPKKGKRGGGGGQS